MALWLSKKIERIFEEAERTARNLGISPHTAYFYLLSIRGRPAGIHTINDTVFHIHQLYNLEKNLLFIKKDFYILVYNTKKGTISGYEANEEELMELPGLKTHEVFSPYPDPPFEEIWTSIRIDYYLNKAHKSFSKEPEKFDSLRTAYFVEIMKDIGQWDYSIGREKGLETYIYQTLGVETRPPLGLIKDFYVVNKEPEGTYTGFEADEHELLKSRIVDIATISLTEETVLRDYEMAKRLYQEYPGQVDSINTVYFHLKWAKGVEPEYIRETVDAPYLALKVDEIEKRILGLTKDYYVLVYRPGVGLTGFEASKSELRKLRLRKFR
jgi:hypothetical protein